MGTRRTARLSVTEISSDNIHLMTDVSIAFSSESTGVSTWRCESTGDIGRGIAEDEVRTWFFTPQNDQTASINFGIAQLSDISNQILVFSIDVSSPIQEGKIYLATQFPFFNGMNGFGTIDGPGGRFAKGTKIKYIVSRAT